MGIVLPALLAFAKADASLSLIADAPLVCNRGEVPWDRARILHELELFKFAYESRPITNSVSGSNLFHAFAQWCLVRMLKPQVIVESGVMLGWGTYMLRQAAGINAHIIVISPQHPSKVHLGSGDAARPVRATEWHVDRIPGKSTYLTDERFVDFSQVNWPAFGLNTTTRMARALVYFDDHQSGYRRLIEAQRAGFTHVMYDDGYPWPGDNFAIKQACDPDGTLLNVYGSMRAVEEKPRPANPTEAWARTRNARCRPEGCTCQPSPSCACSGYVYTDNFASVRHCITQEQKRCIFSDLMARTESIFEFPPIWNGTFRGQSSATLYQIVQPPLLSPQRATTYALSFFRNMGSMLRVRKFLALEASRYTFFTYVKLRQQPRVSPPGESALSAHHRSRACLPHHLISPSDIRPSADKHVSGWRRRTT